jgi:hypothetical protein
MIVDCMTCPVRDQRCGDCVVTVLSGIELQLDATESRVVSMLVGAGLVGAETAAGLHARREAWGAMGAVG